MLFGGDGSSSEADPPTSDGGGVMYVYIGVVIASSNYLSGDGVVVVIR